MIEMTVIFMMKFLCNRLINIMWSELVQAFLGFARGTLAPLGRHHSKSPTPAYGDPSSEGKTAPLGRHHNSTVGASRSVL